MMSKKIDMNECWLGKAAEKEDDEVKLNLKFTLNLSLNVVERIEQERAVDANISICLS